MVNDVDTSIVSYSVIYLLIVKVTYKHINYGSTFVEIIRGNKFN